VRDLLDSLENWHREGIACAVARLVTVVGSGPRLPGAAMAVSSDSVVVGSISGGCVESAVVTEALKVLDTGTPSLVRFSFTDDEALSVGLTCGGTVQVFIEVFDWLQ
jgi:xanthine dehydrogenase accessory factor